MSWKPIETAPKGSGEDGPSNVNHPDYISPPRLLLLVEAEVQVGSYDWYYHEGYGMGSLERDTAWVHSGEDVEPSHWMELPS